jgi:predicted transcriptional regulator
MHIARILAKDGHRQKDIAAQLGVSDRMVRKYLKEDFGARARKKRRSILEPFHRMIDETIEENPYTNQVLLYERLKSQRYGGGMTILRNMPEGSERK